jgi:hypothetical protein
MNARAQGCNRSGSLSAWGQGAIGSGGLPPLNFRTMFSDFAIIHRAVCIPSRWMLALQRMFNAHVV